MSGHLCSVRQVWPSGMASTSEARPDDVANDRAALEERGLIERARAGDPEAFGELVRRYIDRAFSIAYRLLQHREDAEDLVQEACLITWEQLDRFTVGRPFRPWFFRILVNRGLNARRARRIRHMEPLSPDVMDTAASPVAEAELGEIRRHLTAALAGLPEQQQTIVWLFDGEGFSSSEIGEILNMSSAAVRSHLFRARRTLRVALERVGYSLEPRKDISGEDA